MGAIANVPRQLRDSAEFNEFISEQRICLVMFYTVDCVKCESLMASFFSLSEQLVELSLDWHLATVNCSEEVLHGKSRFLTVVCALLHFFAGRHHCSYKLYLQDYYSTYLVIAITVFSTVVARRSKRSNIE